jgi:hypothetical protein
VEYAMVQTRRENTLARPCPLCLGTCRQPRTLSRNERICRLCQGSGYVRPDRVCRCGLPANWVWNKTGELFCGRTICQPREPVKTEPETPLDDFCWG